ncbi:helix-turn-helix domain-containing protein [Massilia sp. Root1485]|uniref:transcriptional regulator n=1 Tax=Massilia sp. Root1485 TaxID=1736472 RepID=UPI0009EC3D72|nr:helix-turn-helix domain-containing protein [Massilia sp. Root1485]
MTAEEALDQASEIVGSMQALGEKLGVTKGAVGQWKLPGRRVPAEHCPAIERLTSGVVRCEDLRPDVDWAIVRATPDRKSEYVERGPDRRQSG